MRLICIFLTLAPCLLLADSSTRLPDGIEFQFWEKPLTFTKTYYVDGNSAAADDNGPGTKERPFRTINKAAQVLQPGERVVIAAGVYRETVSPARGGSGPDKMISYEAAPGAKVFVKGSAVLDKGWKLSTGAGLRGGPPGSAPSSARIWQIEIDNYLSTVYNPFAMVNAPGNRYWLNFKVINTAPYFRRRGMVYADGKPLEPVDQYVDLFGPSGRATSYYDNIPPKPLFDEMGGSAGRFWVDLKGNTIYVRLNGDDSPENHLIEATVREQVFAPKERGLGYIRIKGITFQHSSDPIPLPQSGMVVTLGGHHWIIEDNTFEWGNALCLQVGGGGPPAGAPPSGSHIIRGNTIRYCGIGGIEGVGAGNVGLVEKNLIEWIGWQDAERSWEAGGVKFYGARNMLFRDNVIRHMRNAAAFWLDVGNVNNRVTRNVMADVVSVSGIIHIEATHEQNQIDNNIIWGVKNSETGGGLEDSGGTCIFVQGTDKLIIANNLIGNCQTISVFAVPVEKRIIGTRGGTARLNKVYNNIFHSWGTAALGFMNEHNQSDGNLYLLPPQAGGYIRILAPEPQQWLDVDAWREFYGQEK
ncbi:MAG TPA: right-handed parallel beta-helix repeat-containing protein, partial [Bryobacteraceae bacterium]|nr:right-handed parallel beta-helix repeat-containing protein [Bryobacteraceae bacterium]